MKRSLPFTVWLILLAILHQDTWFWGDRSLVFGFLPAGMAWHVFYSILTALTWLAAIKWAWPGEWEAWAAEGEESPSTAGDA